MTNQLENYHYQLDEALVLHFMGYGASDRVNQRILHVVREQMAGVHRFTDQWGSAVHAPVADISDTEVILELDGERLALRSSQLPKVLRRCDAVAMLLITAGHEVSTQSRRAKGENPLEAFVLDAIGSAMAVELMLALTSQVATEARRCGYGTTLRLGPGYTGWHIDDQARLFSCFNAGVTPVSFTGTMMRPEKTLLGLVGLRPNGREAPEIEPCRLCDLDNCRLRRSPFRGLSTPHAW
jgi:hypothetical protein